MRFSCSSCSVCEFMVDIILEENLNLKLHSFQTMAASCVYYHVLFLQTM